jgi:hypothetical protein
LLGAFYTHENSPYFDNLIAGNPRPEHKLASGYLELSVHALAKPLERQIVSRLGVPYRGLGSEAAEVMRALRLVLSVLIAGWGLVNLLPLISTVGIKLGWFPVPPGLPANLRLLSGQIPWWGLAVWLVMIVMYLLVARALMRGRPAFGLFVLAFVTELVRWVPMYALPIYTQTWTSGEMRFRYSAWGVLFAIGFTIWWVERKKRPPIAAQAH